MKISCQSCGARYTIADEKVLGKVVKIRCKKCSSTIVVNGNDASAGGDAYPPQSAQAYDYSPGPDVWTVSVTEGDQRTMTVQEIVTEFGTGVVTDDTYCWKDGMDDWLPLRDIEALYSACTSTASDAPSPPATPPGLPPEASVPSPTSSGGNLFGSVNFATGAAPSAPTAVTSEPGTNGISNYGNGIGAPIAAAARRAGGRAAGADLFGSVEQAGGEDDVMTSAPVGVPQLPSSDAPGGKLTGQRNENSVLFSLAALTQNGPRQDPSATAAEGSGLIDIRALSAAMGAKKDDRPNRADDIMNLAGGGAFSPALAAPVLAPPPVEAVGMGDVLGSGAQKKPLMALIAAGVLALLGGIGYLVVGKSSPPVEASPSSAAPTAAVAGNAAVASPPEEKRATPPEPAATAPAAPVAAPPSTGATVKATSPVAPKGGGFKAAVVANSDSPKTEPAAPAAARKPASLEDELRKAAGAKNDAPAAAAASAGTAPFDRGAALAALNSIASSLSSCKKPDGPTGTGKARVTFEPNGSVSRAEIDPPFGGTAVGGCIAGKFRTAHVPAFSGGSITAGKSFSIN